MLRRFASSVLSALPGYMRFQLQRFQRTGGSPQYWERRYRQGGNSGDGSYGRLAEFKAQVLNDFVAAENIGSVIEFGCGDGNQLSLARYPKYLGLDVAPTAVKNCASRFQRDATKSFLLYEPNTWFDRGGWVQADVALSLDVLYHLVEDEVYRLHLQHLFSAARRFVVIYSSDTDEPPPAPHVRPRRFTADVAKTFPHYCLEELKSPSWTTGFRNPAPDSTPAAFHFFRNRSAAS